MCAQYITCISIIWYFNYVSIHIYLIYSLEYNCPFYENATSWMERETNFKSDKILFKLIICWINIFIYQINT